MKKRPSKATGILLISFLLFAVVLGSLVYRKYDTATRTVEPPAAGAPAGTAIVTLFFATPEGEGLVREGREVELEGELAAGIETVVKELVSGPVGDFAPTLPAGTRVLGVRMNGDVAQIDFGRELKDETPSGSSAEMAAVYSVVDTVAANFPAVKGVQFLIEGAPVQDLKGHLDLSNPIAPDFTLEQAAPAAAEAQEGEKEREQK